MKQINTYINEKLQLTSKQKYICQPKDKYELRKIIEQRIKDEGSECDLNDIDVSKITDMYRFFDAANYKILKDFNGDVSQWDVSNVEDMSYMFNDCKKFNCDLSRWNVSHVNDIYGMFSGCKNFDCDLSKWDMSNITNIDYMFFDCKKFNQDLDSWDVSNMKEMNYAFYECPTQPKWYDRKNWER